MANTYKVLVHLNQDYATTHASNNPVEHSAETFKAALDIIVSNEFGRTTGCDIIAPTGELVFQTGVDGNPQYFGSELSPTDYVDIIEHFPDFEM